MRFLLEHSCSATRLLTFQSQSDVGVMWHVRSSDVLCVRFASARGAAANLFALLRQVRCQQCVGTCFFFLFFENLAF